ncbi:MAG TPA: hypothetical protein VLA05_07105 [Coriobacteriia bacterium]|nr:hypothetical protein [Coriobacteriia bacterium]
MTVSIPSAPEGHGELLVHPPFEEWVGRMEGNRNASAEWEFAVGGVPASELRRKARAETLSAASAFSARLGVPVRAAGSLEQPIVMTGHQPELYHPGVWVKNFLLQKLSDSAGASAIDVVVDSDGFDEVSIVAPCYTPELHRCRQLLAAGSTHSCFACAPSPGAHTIGEFCAGVEELLSTLPAPSVRSHFAEFSRALEDASVSACNLSELITFARRRYEASAGNDYAELPVSRLARSGAFADFVADIALNAERFAGAYNSELDEYRDVSRTRSAAQPFPNLAIEGDRIELPLWALAAGTRETVWAERSSGAVRLMAGERLIASLDPVRPSAAAEVVACSALLIAPKALLLTLYVRMFCCDLFIHGTGGGRYDQVTDGVCRRYFGVEPPAYVVASLTMHLPLGGEEVTDAEVSSARERLNRLDRNPDEMLDQIEFGSAAERARAEELAGQKRQLVIDISAEGADKKRIGGLIRQVNAELSLMLKPVRLRYEQDLRSLESRRAAADILTDRTYPFCFWAPAEIAETVR